MKTVKGFGFLPLAMLAATFVLGTEALAGGSGGQKSQGPCAQDRMRFCGSPIMSPSCKLKPHIDELSPKCRAAMEKAK